MSPSLKMEALGHQKLFGEDGRRPLRPSQALGMRNNSAGLGWAKPWLLIAGEVIGLDGNKNVKLRRAAIMLMFG